MYTHNLDPILIDLGVIAIRWYSISYVLGILAGWWLGKKIIYHKINSNVKNVNDEDFDNYITYLIFSIIIGGRLGYVLFYNFTYYISNPLEIIMIWKGGMSFHGGLIGVVIGTYLFSTKKKIKIFNLFDVVACVAPIGIFFGRISNFINGELYGKPTDVFWSVVFPKIDNLSRHPSQIYEALLEGLVLFLILNYIIFKKNYKEAQCSYMFLIFYTVFRIFSEQFRVSDYSAVNILGNFSTGSILSFVMLIAGLIIFYKKSFNQR